MVRVTAATTNTINTTNTNTTRLAVASVATHVGSSFRPLHGEIASRVGATLRSDALLGRPHAGRIASSNRGLYPGIGIDAPFGTKRTARMAEEQRDRPGTPAEREGDAGGRHEACEGYLANVSKIVRPRSHSTLDTRCG